MTHGPVTRRSLVKTLGAYLDANGNIASAARALYLNRHSLVYRLRKIADLTGLDVTEPDDRLMLEMCVKIRQLQAIAVTSPGPLKLAMRRS